MIEQAALNAAYTAPNSSLYESPELALKRLSEFTHSGLALVNKISPTESVIDIGCGQNIFKKYIPNLIGIDPVYDAADYKTDLQSFVTDQKFDVAFCLGSIHHGNEEDIEQQISRVVALLKPKARIYWRLNPYAGKFGKFEWTLEYSFKFAKQFNFDLVHHEWEMIHTQRRLYVEWAN